MQYKIKLTLTDSMLLNSSYPLLGFIFGNDEINALEQEAEELANFLIGDYVSIDFKTQLPDKETELKICEYYLSEDNLEEYYKNAKLKQLYYEASYITSVIELWLEGDINTVNDIKRKLNLSKANTEVDYINVANLYEHPFMKVGDEFQELIYIPQYSEMNITPYLNKTAQGLIKSNKNVEG